MSPDEVVEASRPRTLDTSRAAAHFELGQHLWHTEGFSDPVLGHLARAHTLQPDNITYKRQAYSAGIGHLWPGRDPRDLFILDETVYRRIVWQGGGGYLAVHDLPGSRWAFFGPWELTLGPKVRYNRWIEKSPGNRLRNGKLLIDLTTAPRLAAVFSVEALGEVIEASRAALGRLAAYELPGLGLPEIGRG